MPSQEHKESPIAYRINFANIFLGVLLIAFGGLFLASNLGVLPALAFNINFWQLWPLLIIIAGLSLLNGRGWFSLILGSIVTLVLLGLVLLIFLGGKRLGPVTTRPISIQKDPSATSAIVEIAGGAGNIRITGDSEQLVSGALESNGSELTIDTTIEHGIQKATLNTQGKWQGFLGNYANTLTLGLNSSIPLLLTLDAGATSMYIDVRDVMTQQLDITVGASSLELFLGNKVPKSSVAIDAGASSLHVVLPKDSGAQVSLDSALTSTSLDGFTKVDDNRYVTPNYTHASSTIDISLDLGVSSLDIDWQ